MSLEEIKVVLVGLQLVVMRQVIIKTNMILIPESLSGFLTHHVIAVTGALVNVMPSTMRPSPEVKSMVSSNLRLPVSRTGSFIFFI